MPFPFTRREDHGEDMGLPGQKPQDFLILTIVGIQKALADEDEGHLGLLNLGLDDFMPWLPAEDLAIIPKDGAVFLKPVQKSQQGIVLNV